MLRVIVTAIAVSVNRLPGLKEPLRPAVAAVVWKQLPVLQCGLITGMPIVQKPARSEIISVACYGTAAFRH